MPMPMSKMRVVLGSAAIVAYLMLLSAGMLMDSKPYRDLLVPSVSVTVAQAADAPAPVRAVHASGAATWGTLIAAFAAATILYTPTNVAFLTLLAGFLGGCASQITYARDGAEALTDAQVRFRTETPFASMVRSFVVYLAFIAGTYVMTNEPFANVTTDQYVRLAGTISFFAFVVGYDPTKFQDLVTRLPVPQKK